MATGGAFSLSKGSEYVFEYCCTPCSKDGDFIEAVNQCLDCDEYFCTRCIRVHNKMGATSDHKVLDQKDMRKTKGSNPHPPSQRCKAHGGERITAFCGDHDVVCCNTGVAVDHKNCDDIQYIIAAAAGINSSKNIQTTKTSIRSTLNDAKGKRNSLQTDLVNLDKDKAANIQQVQGFTGRQIHRLRELEKVTIEQINSKHKELSDIVGGDATSLDEVISTLEGDLKKLDVTHGNQESQTFVNVKLGQRHEAEGQLLLQQMNKPSKPSRKFMVEVDIEQFLKGISSLGRFVDDRRLYQAELNGDKVKEVILQDLVRWDIDHYGHQQ